MRRTACWSILSLLGYLVVQQAQAQPAQCRADDLCIPAEAITAPEKVDRVSPPTKVAKPTNMEPCPDAPVDVAAESPDERRLACSAAAEAIQRLAACGLTPRRAVRFQIMSEVRHPLSGTIAGLFDPT